MPKCAVVADEDPCLLGVTAHLLTAVFDTNLYRSQIRGQFDFYTSASPCFDCSLAAEIIEIPVGDFQAPGNLEYADVVALITTSGVALNDNFAGQLLKYDVPLLRLGEFHPSKIDFVDFTEEVAGHSFAIALAEASVGLSNFLVNLLVPAN
jgi:hypothetical protein